MKCLLLISTFFVLSMPAPRGPIWWNVEDMMWNAEDWAYDVSYNLTHMNAGGPLGFGILGTTAPPHLDFLRDFWALSFLPPLVLQQPQLLQSVQVSLDWDWPVKKTYSPILWIWFLSNIYFSLISCPYSPLVEEDLLIKSCCNTYSRFVFHLKNRRCVQGLFERCYCVHL